MRKIREAELRAFRPGANSAHTVATDTLVSVELTEAAGDALDSGTISLNTTGSRIDDPRISSGDKLELYLRLDGEQSLSLYWTAIARDISDTLGGGTIRRVEIEATDFPFSVLSFRQADGAFDAVDAGAVVDSLVASTAPEVGRSQIDTVGTDATITVSGRRVLDVITQDLAPIGDAVVAADGEDLVFRSLGAVQAKHQLSPADVHAPIQIRRVDDGLVNRVRVDGGTGNAVDDQQLTQSALVRVTESNRLTTQVQTRKSEVSRIQLYTDPDPNSDDNLVVRLQAPRNGAPVAVNDNQSDIARRVLAPDFLTEAGFTEFQLPANRLPPDEDPFIIVEADGTTGHDVGTDGSGTPTYEAVFPYPLLARAENGTSQGQYRRRDLRRSDETLGSEQAVEDAATAILRHRGQPERRISASAESLRAHRLRPAEAVSVTDVPVADIAARYLVTERRATLENRLLSTELTLADVRTI